MEREEMVRELDRTAPRVVQTDVVYRRMRDPALLRLFYQVRHTPVGENVAGSSPPDLFIGRYGYPKVLVGPLVPQEHGDTMELATPESWVGKGMDAVVSMCTRLVRGMMPVSITDVQARPVGQLQEMLLSKRPVDTEADFIKRPHLRIDWRDDVQPHGPSAPLRSFRTVENGDTDFRVEKVFSDTDLLAWDGVQAMYEKGVMVSKIQRVLASGMLGNARRRRLVPTRWSITAVDDMLGREMLREVKENPPINEYRIYEFTGLDNQWEVLMLPERWSYELVEAWWPGTVWNRTSPYVAMCSSAEGFFGRKTYAEIGGCYYAARMASAELLKAEGRQAGVIILRESRPGYIMPVGVWNVREHVRAAYKTKPLTFPTLKDALERVASQMQIPLQEWVRGSKLLREKFRQRRLTEY